MIFIIKGFRTIVFIFIVISRTFWPICLPAFFRCLSNSGTFTELRITSFIESTGVACSDSVIHNRVEVFIPVLLFTCSQDWTRNVQQYTWRNGYRFWFPKLLRRQSSGGCRFNNVYLLYTTAIMISITIVIQTHLQMHIRIQKRSYTKANTGTNTIQTKTGELCCSEMNGLLIPDFSSSTQGKKHNSYYDDNTILPHQRMAHLMVFKISVGRDPKIPTTWSTVKIQLSTLYSNGRDSTLCLYGPMSTFNWLFFF